MKIKLNKRRRLVAENEIKNENNTNKSETNFNNYLSFVKGKKRQSKINLIKQNKKIVKKDL